MSLPLEGAVAVVTGASRGVGKGIALGLGEAGATVVVTGRTSEGGGALPGTLTETADAVTARGGRGVARRCDHAKDDEVAALFAWVRESFGRLDVLVNNAFAVPAPPLARSFWELPLSTWDTMHQVGLRSHYVASVYGVPLMLATTAVPHRSRLIVNVSSFGGLHYAINTAYGVGKAGVDRFSRDAAKELRPHGVAVVSLYPGIVKTERVLADVDGVGFDLSNSESPVFSGRAVAALAADDRVLGRSGKVLVVAELASEYGFTDEGGHVPTSLRRP